MKNGRFIYGLMLMLILPMGLSIPSLVFGGNPLKVFVSILPQKYFVERIGGDRVEVSVMVFTVAVRTARSPAI